MFFVFFLISLRFNKLEERTVEEVREKFNLLYKQNYEDIPWYQPSNEELDKKAAGLEGQIPVDVDSISKEHDSEESGGDDSPPNIVPQPTKAPDPTPVPKPPAPPKPEDNPDAYWDQCKNSNAAAAQNGAPVQDPCSCYKGGLGWCYGKMIGSQVNRQQNYCLLNDQLDKALIFECSIKKKFPQSYRKILSNISYSRNVQASCTDLGESPSGPLKDLVNRINLYRYLVGINNVKLQTKYNLGAQKVAKAHAESNVGSNLKHDVSGFKCADSEAIEYGPKSNLYYRGAQYNPVDAVDAWMDDHKKQALGHRRWILHPPVGSVGFGMYSYYSALRIIETDSQPYPTDIPFIAFPAPGPFPRELMYPAFSFSLCRTYVSFTQNSKFTLKTFKIDDVDYKSSVSAYKADQVRGLDETFRIDLNNVFDKARKSSKIDIEIEVDFQGKKLEYEYTIKPFQAGPDQYCFCSYCSTSEVCISNGCPINSEVIQIDNTFYPNKNKNELEQRYGCYQYLSNGKGCGAMDYLENLIQNSNNKNIIIYTLGSDSVTYKRAGLNLNSLNNKNVQLKGLLVPYGSNAQWVTLYRENSGLNPINSELSLRKTQFAASSSYNEGFSDLSDISVDKLDLDWFTATELPNRWKTNKLYLQTGDQPKAVYIFDDYIKIQGRTNNKLVTVATKESKVNDKDDKNRVIYTDKLYIVTSSSTLVLSRESLSKKTLEGGNGFSDVQFKVNSGNKLNVEVKGDISNAAVKSITFVNPVGENSVIINAIDGAKLPDNFINITTKSDDFPPAPDKEIMELFVDDADSSLSSSRSLGAGPIAGITIGVIAGVVLLAGCGLFAYMKIRSRMTVDEDSFTVV